MKIKEREERTKLDKIILGRDGNRVEDIHEMNGGKKRRPCRIENEANEYNQTHERTCTRLPVRRYC